MSFDPTKYPLYEFRSNDATILDVSPIGRRRPLAPIRTRTGRAYYRLLSSSGTKEDVWADEIFGDRVNLPPASVFNPFEFSDRYDFDFETGAVTRLPGRGPKSGQPLTPHEVGKGNVRAYQLTRNGPPDAPKRRQWVTPEEIVAFAQGRRVWEVPAPAGSRVFRDVFPNHAFCPGGTVVRIRGSQPQTRPLPVRPTVTDSGPMFELMSAKGMPHRFDKVSIQKLFA